MVSRFKAFVMVVMLSAVGCAAECSPFSVGADYLFLLPCQAGMSYAMITESISTTANPRNVEHTFEWDSGVRVNLGYELPCFCLELEGRWMHLCNDNTVSKDGTIIFATPFLGIFDNPIVSGSGAGALATGVPESQWKMELNMFDLDLKYALIHNQCVRFSAFFGAKGGWIEQEQMMRYLNFVNSASATDPANAIATEYNNFYGAGPLVGLELFYHVGCDVYLHAAVDGAMLFGQLQSPATYVGSVTGPGAATVDIRSHSSTCQTLPAASFQLGLSWESCFCGCYPFHLDVGYELQHYSHSFLNVNSLTGVLFVTNTGYGDLLLQGLKVGGGIRF